MDRGDRADTGLKGNNTFQATRIGSSSEGRALHERGMAVALTPPSQGRSTGEHCRAAPYRDCGRTAVPGRRGSRSP